MNPQAPERCLVCRSELPLGAAVSGPDRLLGLPGRFEVRVCPQCGAGITAPAIAEGDLGGLYNRRYGSHRTAGGGLLGRAVASLKQVQMRSVLGRPPFSHGVRESSGVALDVGCGRGDLAAALLARGWQVDGIEPSEAAAEVARTRGVRIAGSTLSTSRLEHRHYDIVIMRHSLEHTLDPVGDLTHIGHVLRDDGCLVVSVPNFTSWQRRAFGSCWFHLDVPRHRVHWTPSAIDVAMGRAGLTPSFASSSTSALGLPASVQYVLIKRCIAPGGFRLLLAAAACGLCFPLTWLADRVGGERDTLHLIARPTGSDTGGG